MKLSEDTFPILRFLSWDKPLNQNPTYLRGIKTKNRVVKGALTMPPNDYVAPVSEFVDTFDSLIATRWKDLAKRFSSCVDYPSYEFYRDCVSAWPVLKNNDSVQRYLTGRFTGTILLGFDTQISISYDIPFVEGRVELGGHLLVVDRDGFVRLAVAECEEGMKMYASDEFPTVCDIRESKSGKKVKYIKFDATKQSRLDYKLQMADAFVLFVKQHLAFVHFANVQSKYIARAGTREAKRQGADKPVNYSNTNIRRLTTSWYTTTIKTDGFPRRGHFRMQRYKDGDGWTHRLKYIDATYVSGYTRKAKKLLSEEIR